jgi:hypothetical protein
MIAASGSDGAIGTCPVLDQHRLAKGRAHVDGDGTRPEVGATAGRKGHHESDRLARPVGLCARATGQRGAQGQRATGGQHATARGRAGRRLRAGPGKVEAIGHGVS